MGNDIKIKKANFEDIQQYIQQNQQTNTNLSQKIYLINTLPLQEQHCLILHTVNAMDEERIINKLLNNKQVILILYGKNANDPKIEEKYKQLYHLGFTSNQLIVYLGGMFEWLLLQDIYGLSEFPTTSNELDLLKYKAKRVLS